jgi:hypothetical protein
MAKNLVKHGNDYRGTFLHDDAIHRKAIEFIDRHYGRTRTLRKLIKACNAMRNNLAHGNSDRRLENIRHDLGELMARYDEVCRFDDPLGRFQTR